MFKIIKEMLPPDVRVARDAQDLLVECCRLLYGKDLGEVRRSDLCHEEVGSIILAGLKRVCINKEPKMYSIYLGLV